MEMHRPVIQRNGDTLCLGIALLDQTAILAALLVPIRNVRHEPAEAAPGINGKPYLPAPETPTPLRAPYSRSLPTSWPASSWQEGPRKTTPTLPRFGDCSLSKVAPRQNGSSTVSSPILFSSAPMTCQKRSMTFSAIRNSANCLCVICYPQ